MVNKIREEIRNMMHEGLTYDQMAGLLIEDHDLTNSYAQALIREVAQAKEKEVL
jgi:hypothetical protein